MYTVKEVAEIFSVCTRTIERLIRGGEIEAVKIGGLYRIEDSEVERIRKYGTEKNDGDKIPDR